MFAPSGTQQLVDRFQALRDSFARVREAVEVQNLLYQKGYLDAVLDQLFSADSSAQPGPAAGLESVRKAALQRFADDRRPEATQAIIGLLKDPISMLAKPRLIC